MSELNSKNIQFFANFLCRLAKDMTRFYYQKLKVKPRKGLTLIWPVDWTHTHRGIVAPDEEKMILTGWFSFAQPQVNLAVA